MMRELWKEHELRLKQLPGIWKNKDEIKRTCSSLSRRVRGGFLTRCFMTRCLRVAFGCPRCPHHNHSSIRSAAGAGRPDFGCRGSFQHCQFLFSKTRTTPRSQGSGIIVVLILSNIIEMIYNQYNFAIFRITLNIGNFTLIHLFYLYLISYLIVESLSLSLGCLCLMVIIINNKIEWSDCQFSLITLQQRLSGIHTLRNVESYWFPSAQTGTCGYVVIPSYNVVLHRCMEVFSLWLYRESQTNYFSSQNEERQRKWLQKSKYQFSGCQRPGFHTA